MRRRISRGLAAVATTALGFTLLSPATAQAEEVVSGNYTSVFNYSTPNGPYDNFVSNGIGSLIDLADSGTLYLSMYLFGDAGIQNKLLAAQARGVTLKMVTESGGFSDQAGLVAGLTGNSSLTQCDNGCLYNPAPADGKGINHNKFAVLDSLSDGRKNVVWQSSQNMWPGQSGELNNAVVISGNTTLAAKFRGAFNRQVQRSTVSGTATYNHTNDDPGAPVEAIFFPRDKASDQTQYGNADIVAHQIDKVNCAADGRIRIVSSGLDGKGLRPELFAALDAKRAAGCAVDAVVRDFSDVDSNKGVNDLTAANINAYGMRPGGCRYTASVGGSCNRGSVHSKYLLTEWKNAAGQRVQHTFTGSHNFTKGALERNDETLLRINDAGVYNAFVANFDKLRDAVSDIDAAKYGTSSQHYSRVNVAAAGDQHYSATASNSSGTSTYLAVVYENGDRHNPADSELGTDVYIRMYKDGVPLWNEKKLNDPGVAGTDWSNQKPDVGVDQNGNAIVVWAGDADGNKYADIEVRKVTSAGVVTDLPRPHASGTGDQIRPTVAVADNGAYTTAWENTADGSTLNQVMASGRTGAGAVRFQDVQVSTINAGATAGSNRRPDAAIDTAGNTAIVWEEDADGNAGINVGLAKLDNTGAFAVTRRVANSLTDGQQTKPAVAQTADGRIVAAWSDQYTTGTGTLVRPDRVHHRVYSAAGAPTGAESRTTEDNANIHAERPIGAQVDADVAVSDDGSFVVAWREAFMDGFHDVFARGFNADKTTTNRLPATRMNVVTGGNQSGPAVSLAPDGRLSLTYSDDYDGNKFNEMRLRDAFLNQ
ncbi:MULTISPECIES: phospholipase D-like domain-containing protein [unclassified Streptomyces]|uniref:phospholipase D-like domain-containing protein n=1 Tax=unclassified Streptomyces TaxID=2593676 RepID=UPI000823E7AC|nr:MULTISPECIES: phospholipase D-like domain-containing protein [unclassified Streptomyces]SCK35686.1 Phosphatidylserine/phosphatidylglycerophosphate/cardiolipin synthase [Streptomyces sp. AmelKG-E11A]